MSKNADCPLLEGYKVFVAERWEEIRKVRLIMIPWYLPKLPDESASLICVRILRFIKAGLNQVCSICYEARGVLA